MEKAEESGGVGAVRSLGTSSQHASLIKGSLSQGKLALRSWQERSGWW